MPKKTKFGNDLSNKELGYHFFSKDELVEALDDYAVKRGWKWGKNKERKTLAHIVMHKKSITIEVIQPSERGYYCK